MVLTELIAGCKDIPDTKIETGPIAPEDVIATFDLEPGFKIELVASEPLVSDPVDMEIDEYGRMYVVEMHGYPLDKTGIGKIKMLSDVNGDGRMDKSAVFADQLILPFGIMRWKKGLLVADAPNMIYFEDTDGDSRADIRDTLLTGFAFSNAQMNAGNPIYGLDNWIYLTSESGGTYQIYKKEFGDLGSDIFFPGKPGTTRIPLENTGRTVRFRPDRHQLELTSGVTQFGHDFDVWGHHLLGDNSNHIYHEVMAAPYLKRNPDLLISTSTQTLTDHGSEVFSITRNPERQILSAEGVFTSACGNTAYTGGAFPAPFNENSTFVAEPVSNLVHVDGIKNKGASFVASRIGRERKEFLSSTDSWFRPVNMYVGPDGALYVVDYYRQIIEHPEWMSEEAIQAGGLYNGKDKGRIYRITPTSAPTAAWTKGLHLGDASNEALVKELANRNRWWRLHAQRLLVDRADQQVIPALVQMAKNPASAQGRLHALWTLEGMGVLTAEMIKMALQDAIAGIRENGIKLAELHISSSPELESALLHLHNDVDPKVRFQLLCTIGFFDTKETAGVRDKLLFENLQDNWVQIAALSAASSQTNSLLEVVIARYNPEQLAYASLVQRLASMIGSSGGIENIRHLIQNAAVANPEKVTWQPALLEGLSEGLIRRKNASSEFNQQQAILIKAYFEHSSPSVRKAALQLLKVIGLQDRSLTKAALKKALSAVQNRNLPDEQRVEAINFLSAANPVAHVEMLKKLIIPQEHSSVQLAALHTLSLIPENVVNQYVLQQWPVLTPEVKDAGINTFLTSPERVSILLDAIESGKIQKASINFLQGVQLMTQGDDKLRKRARSIFAHNDEQKVHKEYQKALQLQGNSVKGKIVFTQNCALCHQFKGENGNSFGPDLGTVSKWQPEGIMANILAPNLSIAANYELWVVELTSGESIQGIITSETPAAIQLKNVGGVEKMIPRSDIKSLNTLNISAMPAGLEKSISHQDMADLLAFLRQNN
ncbi:c-type cytochrome [Rhodocytophaga rosea]|uniref:C-type cytochrome n=2 Tax=Rhodocytophaga rosea TaxID=2704465 RepID=A0A6C0GWL8_9BACT|nr:c-type cytochrome [Rhodocytophaga rosea]